MRFYLRSSVLVLVAVMLILGLTLTGCGTVTPPAQQPIKLGAVFPLTTAIGQEQANAAQLAVEQINTNGGLLNRTVTLTIYDDGNDPATAAAKVTQLCTVDNVSILCGGMGSATSLGAASALQTYHKVTVWLGAASNLFEQAMANLTWFFHVHPWDYMQSAQQYGALMAVNSTYNFTLTKIFVAYENSAFGAGSYNLTKAAMEALGYNITGQAFVSVYYGGTGADLPSLVSNAKAFDPDYFAFICYDADVIPLLTEMKTQAFNPPFILGAPPSWPLNFGSNPLSQGISGFTMWTPALKDLTNTTQAFYYAYIAKYHVAPPDYIGPLTYDNIMIIADAIERAGSLDDAALITALNATDYDSAVGDHHVGFAPSAMGCLYQANFTVKMFQWLNGTAEIIYPWTYATANFTYPHPAWPS
jgi:branched-chain amino acid transport system substrate-binding protein